MGSSIFTVYLLRLDHQYLINPCVDGDNETNRPIHHSLEQYTPFLLQTRARVHRIRHQRYD